MNAYRQFASEAHDPGRIRAIEELWSDQLRMDIAVPDRAAASFELRSHSEKGLTISSFYGSTASMTRTVEQAANFADDVVLCVCPNARVRIVRRGGEESLYDMGEPHVWMANESLTCEVDRPYRAVMVTAPRAMLETAMPESRGAGRYRAVASEARLLAAYASSTLLEFPSLGQPATQLALNHIRDLLRLTFSLSPDVHDPSALQGSAAARLALIKKDVLANLSSPELGSDWIARRHGISPRYLRTLFAQDDSRFTHFVLESRLALAHRLLSDATLSERNISSIAFDSGFGDLSYFNRTFRHKYGLSPSDVRQAAVCSGT